MPANVIQTIVLNGMYSELGLACAFKLVIVRRPKTTEISCLETETCFKYQDEWLAPNMIIARHHYHHHSSEVMNFSMEK